MVKSNGGVGLYSILGRKDAQYVFSHACLEGIGVKKDVERAKYYLKLADQGMEQAKKLLKDIK